MGHLHSLLASKKREDSSQFVGSVHSFTRLNNRAIAIAVPLTFFYQHLFFSSYSKGTQTQLAEIAKDIEAAGVHVNQELRLGNAYHGITTTITTDKADPVVMGTSSRSKLEELIVGSNTKKRESFILPTVSMPILSRWLLMVALDFPMSLWVALLKA